MADNHKGQNIVIPRLDELLGQAAVDPVQMDALIAYFLLSVIANDSRKLQHYVEKVQAVLSRWEEEHIKAKAFKHFVNGSVQFYLSNFTEAAQELLLSLEVISSTAHRETEGIVRTLLGANYRSMGEMDLAIENQLRAYQLLPRKGLYATYRILCLYQLGETHVVIKEFVNALHYYEEAVADMDETLNTGIRFRIYSGLGICQMHLGAFEESQHSINIALQIPGLSIRLQSRALLDLGIIQSSQGKHTEAIVSMKQSYELRKANDLIDASSTSLLNLSKEYIATGQYTEALQSLNEALQITQEFNAKVKRIEVLELLARTHKLLHQYESSAKYYEEYVLLREAEHAEQERRIFRFKNDLIEQQRKELDNKNRLLNITLDELSNMKRSRLAMAYGVITVIVLVLLTEIFVDPLIDEYAYNNYISLALKALIALLLKPIDSFYESMLFNRALRKRNDL